MGTSTISSETHRVGHHEGRKQPHPSPFLSFSVKPRIDHMQSCTRQVIKGSGLEHQKDDKDTQSVSCKQLKINRHGYHSIARLVTRFRF